jgi:hypothetical protein
LCAGVTCGWAGAFKVLVQPVMTIRQMVRAIVRMKMWFLFITVSSKKRFVFSCHGILGLTLKNDSY